MSLKILILVNGDLICRFRGLPENSTLGNGDFWVVHGPCCRCCLCAHECTCASVSSVSWVAAYLLYHSILYACSCYFPGGPYLLSKVPTLCLKAQLKQHLLLKRLLSSLPRAPKVILPQVHNIMVVGPVGVHRAVSCILDTPGPGTKQEIHTCL